MNEIEKKTRANTTPATSDDIKRLIDAPTLGVTQHAVKPVTSDDIKRLIDEIKSTKAAVIFVLRDVRALLMLHQRKPRQETARDQDMWGGIEFWKDDY